MLRHRGLPAVLVAGVKCLKGSALLAHAWVRPGGVVTDGNSENAAFTPLISIGERPSTGSGANPYGGGTDLVDAAQ